MNAFVELRDASLGWLDLIAGRPDVEGKFTFTRAGLLNALGFYVAIVLLLAVIGAALFGMAALPDTIVRNIVPFAAVLGGMALMARPLRYDTLPMLVTAIYAFGFVQLVALVLSLVSGSLLSNVVLGAFCYMLYRQGRVIGGLAVWRALAFALLCVAVLVGLTQGLYMLTNIGQGSA